MIFLYYTYLSFGIPPCRCQTAPLFIRVQSIRLSQAFFSPDFLAATGAPDKRPCKIQGKGNVTNEASKRWLCRIIVTSSVVSLEDGVEPTGWDMRDNPLFLLIIRDASKPPFTRPSFCNQNSVKVVFHDPEISNLVRHLQGDLEYLHRAQKATGLLLLPLILPCASGHQ